MEKTDLIINVNPKSIFSEAIKSIRTNLTFSAIDKKVQVILNTSPEAGDGKSFISANLAVAYAQANKKVLLIDCDLRKGRQHEIFEILNTATGGYTNLILNYKEDLDLSEYLIRTKNKRIDLIPTGPTPPNPIELLSSDNNRMLIKRLRNMYDIIILDCPPVLGLSDALVMTQYSDINMVVVSMKKTKMENLEKTKRHFEQVNATISGVILNKAPLSSNGPYSYYYNDYYTGTSGKKRK